MDFPGGHAGASLKPGERAVRARVGGQFPRRTRRGLIEAISNKNLASRNSTDFPGGHAGASLKPGRGAARRERRTYFPGGHAGASLKPLHVTRRWRCLQDFPGGHAGASLKPWASTAAFAAARARFPRRTRRGLIEARSSGGCASLSLPGFPRRTRRGLIEAGRGGAGLPRAGRISPADTPGPH